MASPIHQVWNPAGNWELGQLLCDMKHPTSNLGPSPHTCKRTNKLSICNTHNCLGYVHVMVTYIPAFFAAATPEGASSNTKQLLGSILPWTIHSAISSGEHYNIITSNPQNTRKEIALTQQYLKPPHSGKKYIRRWLASLHIWIIPHHNMVHQCKHFLVVLRLQGKMTFVGSEAT